MRGTHVAVLMLALCGCRDTPSAEQSPALTTTAAATTPSDSAADAICRGLANSYECAQAIEASLMADASPGVRRDGRHLRIALERGDSLVLTDSLPDDAEGAWFSYRGLLTAVGYHVVEVQYYEGGRYLLVHSKSGWTGSSNGVPIVSPDRSRLAASSLDLDAEFSPTTLQIWAIAADSLIVELDHDFIRLSTAADSLWGPRQIEWITPTELHVEREFQSGASGGAARVVRETDRWRILVP